MHGALRLALVPALLALAGCPTAPRASGATDDDAPLCNLTCAITVQNPLASEVQVSYYAGQALTFIGYVPAQGSQRFVVPEHEPRSVLLVADVDGRQVDRRMVRLRAGETVPVHLRSAGKGR